MPAALVQFSIDESLEFNLNLVDGGVLGAQTVSQQLKAIDFTKLPYSCVARSRPCHQNSMQQAQHDTQPLCFPFVCPVKVACLKASSLVQQQHNLRSSSGTQMPSVRRKNNAAGNCSVVVPHSRVLSNTVFDVSPLAPECSSCCL